ncbi:MAG: hypothetical protein ACXWN0_08170, partial [Isosphaeraceae bacterium]
WRQFYQIAQSLGLFRVAASRAQAWSQLARKKVACLVPAQAVLPNHLRNVSDTGSVMAADRSRATNRTFQVENGRKSP